MSKIKKKYRNNLIAHCSFRLITVAGKKYFVHQLSQNKKFQFGFDFIHPNAGFCCHSIEKKFCVLLRMVLVFSSHNLPTTFFSHRYCHYTPSFVFKICIGNLVVLTLNYKGTPSQMSVKFVWKDRGLKDIEGVYVILHSGKEGISPLIQTTDK